MSSYAKTKAVSVVILVVVSLHEMRVAIYSEYMVFHKLCKTYIFAYAKLYVLHKYMFLHMQKYIPCTKHIVLHIQNI